MGTDHYKVDVLHYINPHLIWVLVTKKGEEDELFFEQIGLYGILPQEVKFEVDGEMTMEPCEHWVNAAVLVMKKLILDSAEIWFSPTYIDKKISIFDDNVHKYGDLIIILKDGNQVNMADEIVDSGFGFKDECLFHEKLRDSSLNTKLNYITTLDVYHQIEETYTIRDIPKKTWQDALKNQTQILQLTSKLESTINARNLNVKDRDNLGVLLKNKMNDFKLCKDVDDDSAGRASVSRSSRTPSLLSVNIKKKLELLKAYKTVEPDLTSLLKPVLTNKAVQDVNKNDSSPKTKDFEQNKYEISSKYKDEVKEDTNNNIKNKKGKLRKHNTMKDANLVAFGPAGLQASKFTVKQASEKEEEVKAVIRMEKTDTETEEEKKEDVYAKVDSEVNIKITNKDILNKIKSENSLLQTPVGKTVSKTVNSKAETLSAMQRKIKYLEDKISKINTSISSASDKESSKCDFDSDNESVTALEEKLGLRKNIIKKDFVKPQPDIILDNIKNDVNPFRNLDGSISIFVDKLVSPVLMVHTKKDNRIKPLPNLRDMPFGTDIHLGLRNMMITKPMRPQTVSWPSILRGHSFFLIGPHASGNTMGYLPAVCRLVNDFKESDNFGLSCIIVCATSLAVSSVETVCKIFLHTAKIFACYTGLNDITITTSLLNGCDLLICTPPMLVRLIQEDFSLDFRNLSTLVIDDCEHLSKVYENELKFCLRKVRDVVKIRANTEWKVQYVVVSRIWCDFMVSLAKKAPDSIICISAFEECVLYSKANTSVEFIMQENKINTVINFLKDIDKSKKTVIVCRDDEEVGLLEKTLTRLKYIVYSCDSTMTVHDLYSLDKILRDYQEPVSGPILVCCDGNLTHLNITDAHYLVHYSLPTLYSMFCKRFAVLIDNYPSIFKNDDCNIKIKILLDDNNIEQLPKILHFIKRCTNEIPAVLDDISASVLSEKDLKKAENVVPLCNMLMTLGKCPDFWNCVERHAIFKEYDDPKAWMPKEGVITFQILYYHSAVHYSARLTSNITKTNTTKYAQTYSLLSIKLGMYYSKEVNRKLHGTPKVGDICAVTLKPNHFVRCQVMKILRSENNQSSIVLIKLIDEEKYEKARDTWLYYLPEDLKSFETHVVKVILANIMPKDKDVTFSKLAEHHLKQITDNNDDLYMRGHISLVVGNVIFVDTLEACQDLSALGEIVVKHDFRKELLEDHASPNPHHIDTLKELCGHKPRIEVSGHVEKASNIDLPKPIQAKPKVRWAHLEKDGFSTIFFMSAESPDLLFVRLIKFDKCCNTLIKDIAKHVEENPEPLKDISVGDIVLAEFPDDSVYERARIERIVSNNTVKCFFVDQGDWRDVSVKKILPIPEKFITVLPFQAIECRLIGIKPCGDNWTDFSTNFLVDSCYDADNKLKQLYAKYYTKEKAEVSGGHKYAIILIDTYTDDPIDTIINWTMAVRMLADENDEINFEEIKFDKDENTARDSDSDIDEQPQTHQTIPAIVKNKIQDIPQVESKTPNNLLRSVPLVGSDDSFDDFDFVTDNSGKLGSVPIAEVVSIKEVPDTDSAQNETRPVKPEKIETPAIKPVLENKPHHVALKTEILNPDHKSKPKVMWRQNSNTVTIKIKLIVDNYDLIIKERSIEFSADANDTKYGFDFELFGVVDLKKSTHANKGQYILVKLFKIMARNWLTLARGSAIAKWIVYDIESIDISSEEEESDNDMLDTKKNNFLKDHDDSDSDDNLQDDVCFSYKRE